MAATIIAVHQVGRRTALVRRTGNQLAAWRLLRHHDDLIEQTSGILDQLAALIEPGDRVAVVALPSPVDLTGHGSHYGDLRRAVLLGALLHDPLTSWAPMLLCPADYGTWALAGYPAALVGPREQRGAGPLRICRAAWDLAGAAMPDGPPTLAADRAGQGDLAAITIESTTWFQDRYRAVVRAACGVCGANSIRRYLAHEDPTSNADVAEQARAAYIQAHVGLHLETSGRARNLVMLDTAQAITAAAVQTITTGGVQAMST